MPNTHIPLTVNARRRLMALAGVMGFVQYGQGFCFPLLKHDLHISRAVASIHSLATAVSIIVISFIVPKAIQRYSPRYVMQAGWIITIIGVLTFSLGRTLYITVPAVFLAVMGGTFFNNTNAVSLGQSAPAPIKLMLKQMSIATMSGATAPLLIGLFSRAGISWRVTLGGLALVFGTIALFSIPKIPNRNPTPRKDGERHWDKPLFLMMGLGFGTTFMEGGIGAWALDLLISRGVVLKSAVVLVTFFTFGLAIGRFILTGFHNVTVASMWLYACVVSTLGILIIIFSRTPIPTMIGLIVAALGISPVAAVAITRSLQSPKGADAGIAANVIGAGVAIGLGPWIMGWVSDGWGFSIAYIIPLVMLVVSTGFYFASNPPMKVALKS